MNELALFNPLFDDGFGFCVPAAYRSQNAYLPRTDVRETKDSYLIDMELPGRTEADVDLSVKDDVLTIASVKKAEAGHTDEPAAAGKWLMHERRTAEFSRSFTLPEDVDAETISAVYKNGVLSITLPRSEKKNAVQKITVTAA